LKRQKLGVDCVSRVLGESLEWSVKNSMVDVTYLAAAWAPTADEDGLILLADWGNWVPPTHTCFSCSSLTQVLQPGLHL
jgi:hypothetical protein